MWKTSRHFIVSSYSLGKFVEHGMPNDVDEFAEILLSV